MERLAPNAWLINFSNPSGILAEMLEQRGGIRYAGLCNAHIGIEKTLRRKAGHPADFDYDYVGLNHLSWFTGVYANGKNIINDLFNDEEFTWLAASPDTAFLRTIGGLPSYYLNYFYNRDKAVAEAKGRATTRGEDCMAIEEDLLKMYQDENLKEKPALLDKRGGAFYSEAAVSLVDAIENDLNSTHIVGTCHKGTIDFLPENETAEIKCTVGKNGPKPLPLLNPNISTHIIGLMQAVKAYEKLTVQAGLTGCYDAGLAALLTHPLIMDSVKAKGVYDEMLEAHKEFLPQYNKNR
jgi:6-phospho-beta-glucosidase